METLPTQLGAQMTVRPLTLDRDFEDVRDLYDLCADYLALEEGAEPDDRMAMRFFTDAPPNHPVDQMLKLGVFDAGAVVGVADLALSYPASTDAFIGLLLLAPSHRSVGLGAQILRHIESIARLNGATRLYLAVLDINPRARAFWEREGFSLHESVNRKLGRRDHLLHRMVRAI